jgi:hypothetical protein
MPRCPFAAAWDAAYDELTTDWKCAMPPNAGVSVCKVGVAVVLRQRRWTRTLPKPRFVSSSGRTQSTFTCGLVEVARLSRLESRINLQPNSTPLRVRPACVHTLTGTKVTSESRFFPLDREEEDALTRRSRSSEAEVILGQGQAIRTICRGMGISEQSD